MSQKEFSISVEINAPPERVWAVISGFERWPEWTASVQRIQPLDPGPVAVGNRYRIWQPKVPPAVWKLTALEPGRAFTWKSGTALARATACHVVESVGAGSRVTLTLTYGGWLGAMVARITRDLNDRYLKMEALGLKARAEGRG